jgi:hypothetical protein
MKALRLVSLATLLAGAIVLLPTAANASTNISVGGRQYLSDVAPLNAAVSKWIKETMKWTNSTTNAQIRAQDAPLFANRN